MTTDRETTAALRAALDESRELDAWDVAASVEDGVARLTGCVTSSAERLAARSLAVSVPGVTALQDLLVVTGPPEPTRLTDEEISRDVAARLANRGAFRDVRARCSFRVAHLEGRVADQSSRRLAHHLASSTPGVHFVVDDLLVADAS
jgi:osmotically-inducible protein OsmY